MQDLSYSTSKTTCASDVAVSSPTNMRGTFSMQAIKYTGASRGNDHTRLSQ